MRHDPNSKTQQRKQANGGYNTKPEHIKAAVLRAQRFVKDFPKQKGNQLV